MPEDGGLLREKLEALEMRARALEAEVRALTRVADLLDRVRALEGENRTLRDKVWELETFWGMSRVLGSTLSLEELLSLALHLIGRSLHVDEYALMLLEEGRLTVRAAFGLPVEATQGLSLVVGEGIAGAVVQSGEAILVPDVNAEPRFTERQWWRRAGTFLCAPLRFKGGEVVGVLCAARPMPGMFTSSDLLLFEHVAAQVAAALENAQLFQRTKELSSRDDLTALYNRRHFFETLEKEVLRARRFRRLFSLVMMDLDGFKLYNDTHGHVQGDSALRTVAGLVGTSLRRADVPARYGGDEFVLLLPEVDKPGATVAAEKIRMAVERHPFPGAEALPRGRLTATLGIAAFPVDAEEGPRLVELADKALYAGKMQGGNRVSPYGLVFNNLS